MKVLIAFTWMFLISGSLFLKAANVPVLKKANSFFPEWTQIKDQKIDWRFLEVPESWAKTDSKTIKLAVAVIHSKASTPNAPVVFIQGGPGAGAIIGLRRWLNHPLRLNRDIILIDMRGTGFSEPTLCPDLGKQFMEVLAENDAPDTEIAHRVKMALDCKNDLLTRKIDIGAYNSKSISLDLHALKQLLGYGIWNVYGISYGTHIAMQYANDFPDDIQSIVLDSSVPPRAGYYSQNTSNYVRALNVLFDRCKKDPTSNRAFPMLEKTYYETIESLKKTSLELEVPADIVPSGKFYFNAEDMMIAIHQCLYDRKLIPVIPLMIKEFHNRNKDILRVLIKSLASRLYFDYGTYYCILCNEMIPYNSLEKFHDDVKSRSRFSNGLSFYEAEFSICQQWNRGRKIDSLEGKFKSNNKPTLILSGDFDPITPPSNGVLTQQQFPNNYFMQISSSGHGPGFSECGDEMIASFIENPTTKPKIGCFTQNSIKFVTDVKLNRGVSSVAEAIVNRNYLKLVPFVCATVLIIVLFVMLTYNYLQQNKLKIKRTGILRVLIFCSLLFLTSLFLLIDGILTTASINPYILAFGLPGGFGKVFFLIDCSIVSAALACVFYLSKIKSMRQIKISVMMVSLVVCNIYFIYWGLY